MSTKTVLVIGGTGAQGVPVVQDKSMVAEFSYFY
jgi:hypothetical protein